MLKKLLIGIGLLLLLGVIALFVFSPNQSLSADEINQYTLDKAYMTKNTRSYALCYNSINYGDVLLDDIQLEINTIQLNVYGERIPSEDFEKAKASFMEKVHEACDEYIDEYESAYNRVVETKEKAAGFDTAWWAFAIGGSTNEISSESMSSYDPKRARMTEPFNSYIFDREDVTKHYDEELGL